MLTQYDIDTLMQTIQNKEKAYVYYVAHMIEIRDSIINENTYKSSPKFKVVKLEVSDIQNAYFEYLNYENNKSNYHIESEEFFYDYNTGYVAYYVVKNSKNSYTKDINPRIPSIVYGHHRKVYDNTTKDEIEVTDPSPIKVKYAHNLEYGNMSITDAITEFNNGKLDWKYKKLNNTAIVDGISYKYITSDWYILNIKNFPKIEMPLVNVEQYSAYFINLNDAFDYIEQLMA